MALTEEQLREAETELRIRARKRSDEYAESYARAVREAEERFWKKMEEAFPGISRDTMEDIYYRQREFWGD